MLLMVNELVEIIREVGIFFVRGVRLLGLDIGILVCFFLCVVFGIILCLCEV